jgi:hypothetical protein
MQSLYETRTHGHYAFAHSAKQQFREFGDIRRDAPRLIAR